MGIGYVVTYLALQPDFFLQPDLVVIRFLYPPEPPPSIPFLFFPLPFSLSLSLSLPLPLRPSPSESLSLPPSPSLPLPPSLFLAPSFPASFLASLPFFLFLSVIVSPLSFSHLRLLLSLLTMLSLSLSIHHLRTTTHSLHPLSSSSLHAPPPVRVGRDGSDLT